MILERRFYAQVSILKAWWNQRQLKRFEGDKVFKLFKLFKVIHPEQQYFYSKRLKVRPQFSGNKNLLSNWKEAKLCETMCPTQAIKVDEETILIDPFGCIGCGECISIAPEGLLTLVDKKE